MSLDAILDTATRARVPVLIWGSPGVGKSAAIKRWAATRGLPCWTVIASLREPSDFGGLPILDGGAPFIVEGREVPTISFAPPRFAVEAAVHGGMIFLDELTTAPPAVQAALLRAVIDKAFGDLDLDPYEVTVIAAANPPEEAAVGWDLAAPLANRFIHYEFPLVARDWVEQFPGYWGEPPELGFAGGALGEDGWGRARSLIAAFILSHPSLLFQMPAEGHARGQAWPSPRTWDFASRLLAGFEHGGGDLAGSRPLLSGCVGEAAARAFVEWACALDLPDPEELLAWPELYQHPEREAEAFAQLSLVCQCAVKRPTTERWRAAWRVLSRAAAAGGAATAVSAARVLTIRPRAELPPLPADIDPCFHALGRAG